MVGFNEAMETHVVKSDVNVGGQLLRQRTKILSEKLSFNIYMTTDQVGLFLLFYQSDLIDGTRPFTFTDPRLGTTVTYTFVDSPTVSSVAYRLYSVSMALRRMP